MWTRVADGCREIIFVVDGGGGGGGGGGRERERERERTRTRKLCFTKIVV